jgi:hypothetical protein
MTTTALRNRTVARGRVDQAAVALLRAVMAEGWRPDQAADELLLRTRADSTLLRALRTRVARAVLDRPTRIHNRATVTVEKALARARALENERPVVPRQRTA